MKANFFFAFTAFVCSISGLACLAVQDGRQITGWNDLGSVRPQVKAVYADAVRNSAVTETDSRIDTQFSENQFPGFGQLLESAGRIMPAAVLEPYSGRTCAERKKYSGMELADTAYTAIRKKNVRAVKTPADALYVGQAWIKALTCRIKNL